MSIQPTFPLYVTSKMITGAGEKDVRSTVQPGGELNHAGSSTISIAKTYDMAEPNDEVRWSASLSKDGSKTSTPLEALPDAGVSPGMFSTSKAGPASHMMTAVQSFALPWSPGMSHLTLVAQNAAGKILCTENFTVDGTYASVLRPYPIAGPPFGSPVPPGAEA